MSETNGTVTVEGGVLADGRRDDPWRAAGEQNYKALIGILDRWRRADALRNGRAIPDSGPLTAPVERARCYLAKEAPAVEGRNGSGQAFHVAAVLVHGFALTDAEALQAVADWNARCQPPWSEQELLHKFADARKATDHKEPRGHLLNAHKGSGKKPGTPSTPVAAEDVADEKRPDDIDGVARLADLKAAGASINWLWTGWIARGVITVIAANGGVGKTRFAMDLMRRVRHGHSWPDGTEQTVDVSARWLWMLADDNHTEAAVMVEAWDLDTAFYLPAPKADPFAGTQLDGQTDRLRHYLRIVRPVFFVVDTLSSATQLKMHTQDEAELLTRPLRKLAIEFNCAVLALTHLNADGGVLGRRVIEKARQVLTMTEPDPEGQPNRRRLWVSKSNSVKPAALGVTLHDNGCDYDANPPREPGDEPGTKRGRGRPAGIDNQRLQAAVDWLKEFLGAEKKAVGITRTAAEAAGFDAKLLYRAKEALAVEETQAQGRKWWTLAADEGEF